MAAIKNDSTTCKRVTKMVDTVRYKCSLERVFKFASHATSDGRLLAPCAATVVG